jgi:LuxR family maltose regulon positive regulatory protein
MHVGPNSVAAALPASLIARILYEEGDLDGAEALVIDRTQLISAGTMLDCVWSAYFVMTRVAAARMNFERAHAILERVENLGVARGWGRLAAAAIAEQARLQLHDGRTDEGAACVGRLEHLARQHPAPKPCAWSEIHWSHKLARAHLLRAQTRLEESVLILQEVHREAEALQNRHFVIQSAIYLSAVQLRLGKAAEAANRFRRILTACAAAGLYQTILDEAPLIAELVEMVHEKAELNEGLLSFVDRLLAAARRAPQSHVGLASRAQALGTLSIREADILKLIAQGMSNKEIARNLEIGPETVKTHLKNVFTKLGVERRAQAVSRAQTLGLVTTD